MDYREWMQDIQKYSSKEIESQLKQLLTLDKQPVATDTYNENIQAFLQCCQQDPRKSVQKIAASFYKAQQCEQAEKLRTMAMYRTETDLWMSGMVSIAGIDEVGRGCVAGPVVAGAVILPYEPQILGLNDSKKLTPLQREALDEQIRYAAIDYAVGEIDAETIDQIGIANATFRAMRQAISRLTFVPDHVLVDAFRIPEVDVPQTNIVGGDGLSASIAAASIVAKVYRDKKMTEYHASYPDYGFDRHKGYGTAEHMQYIAEYGLSSLHRKSFLKSITFV